MHPTRHPGHVFPPGWCGAHGWNWRSIRGHPASWTHPWLRGAARNGSHWLWDGGRCVMPVILLKSIGISLNVYFYTQGRGLCRGWRCATWCASGAEQRVPGGQSVQALPVLERRSPTAARPPHAVFLAEAFTRPKVMYRLVEDRLQPVLHLLHPAEEPEKRRDREYDAEPR